VFARSSYKPDEIVVGSRFADLFSESPTGKPTIDLRRLHALEPVPPAAPVLPPAS